MALALNRVLLADDDEKTRQILTHYLNKWDFVVTSCRDGHEAEAVLLGQDTAPALALIDWEMPGLDGVELCRRIRSRGANSNGSPAPYTYLILVTGRSDKGEVAAGLAAGADDYVTKPFDVDELHARLMVGQRVVALERRLAEHIVRLREALEQVGQLADAAEAKNNSGFVSSETLRGQVPCVCPECRRASDGDGQWQPIESFLRAHGTSCEHQTCPECQAALRPPR
jgi:sigma-B regulation protein RsbU (phosphoserine phosphatase)